MLIPSIDLMGGIDVQWLKGDKKSLEFDNFDIGLERLQDPLVQ